MGLGVSEDGDRSLVDCGEVDEEHVESAAQVVILFRCAFCGYGLGAGAL